MAHLHSTTGICHVDRRSPKPSLLKGHLFAQHTNLASEGTSNAHQTSAKPRNLGCSARVSSSQSTRLYAAPKNKVPYCRFLVKHSFSRRRKNQRMTQVKMFPTFTQCTQLVSRLHNTAASTSRLTPDAALFSLSPDDGLIMPETC